MPHLVFAKKCIFPTGAANVLQSLHMAAAFSSAGAKTRFFPGVKGKGDAERAATVHAALADIALPPEAAASWTVLPGNHAGLYGLRFRAMLALAWFTASGTVFYARDIKEAAFLASLPPYPGKRRLFFEMHETLHDQPHNMKQRERLLQLERRVINKIDGLVVINPALSDKARDIFGYKGPSLIEPSAFSAEIFTPVPLFEAGAPWPKAGEPLHLVYCGRFHPGKGVENLIAAMEYLPPNVHLRVIGGSPESRFKALRQLASRIPGGETRIRFIGTLPQRKVPEACAGAHIFVLPQENDDLYFSPLKLREAAAMGLPILATPIATFDAEKKAGMVALTPGISPQGIAEGVLSLAANPELAARLRENGLAESRSKTWKERARRILDFCRETAPATPQRSRENAKRTASTRIV